VRLTAVYARVSTADQEVEAQLHEVRGACERHGWCGWREFVDAGVSGSRWRRPALDELMRLVRRGRVERVVVWRLDRVSRSLVHLHELLAELQAHDCGFVALREGITTSGDRVDPVQRMFLSVLAAVAEFERDLALDRTRAGIAAAKAAGVAFGRPKAKLPLKAARELLDGGRSMREVSAMLGVSRRTLQRRLKEEEHG